MSEFLTDQQIKERIANEYHERDKKSGAAGNKEYDWTRARRVFEHYHTKPEDDVYWKRNRTQYEEFAYLFADRSVDGTRIKGEDSPRS